MHAPWGTWEQNVSLAACDANVRSFEIPVQNCRCYLLLRKVDDPLWIKSSDQNNNCAFRAPWSFLWALCRHRHMLFWGEKYQKWPIHLWLNFLYEKWPTEVDQSPHRPQEDRQEFCSNFSILLSERPQLRNSKIIIRRSRLKRVLAHF